MTNKDLYDSIISFVDRSLSAILKIGEGRAKSQELEQVRAHAQKILTQYKEKTKQEIKELENLSEWDVFTLAFYGETNAGKSTLIETLRILLGEGEKLKNQQKFQKISENIDFEKLEKSEEKMRRLSLDLDERKKEVQSFQNTLNIHEKREQEQLEQQERDLDRSKKNLSLFQKIMCFFRKMKVEVALEDNRVRFSDLQVSHAKLLQEKSAQLVGFEREVREAKNGFAEANKALMTLEPLQDGEIIGTGRSDFTLHATAYSFQLEGRTIQLLDIPGIEGDEKKVQTEIDASVKKAHTVFYVTRKATPPGSGSDGQEGTIDKIKRQLGDQTEVWALYNKNAPSPRVLIGDALLNDGEQESLVAMNASLQERLGSDVFQGTKTVSCIPAFYAAATCLLPTNSHYRNKKKFLEAMPVNELLRRSGMTDFIEFLKQEICVNQTSKIKNANLKKIRACLEQGIAYIQGLRTTFDTLSQNLDRQYSSSSVQIDDLLQATMRRLESECKDYLADTKSAQRNNIYEYIEADCSNDDFKNKLEAKIDSLKESVGSDLEKRFEVIFDSLKCGIQQIVEKNKRNIDEIMEYSIPKDLQNNDFSFQLDFKMKNGLNVVGILSSLGGAAGLIWVAFLSSNPAGWTVAAVLGAIGLVFSFYKSVRGYFSSKYKMEQQRKSADENLKNVFEKLEEMLLNNLKQAGKKLGEALAETKTQLKIPLEQSLATISTLSEIGLRMADLKKRIV